MAESVLVLGGSGAAGKHLVEILRAAGVEALAAGRNRAHADRVIDLSDPTSLSTGLDGVSVVVNCSGIENPTVAAAAAARGIAFTDITSTYEYLQQLEQVDGPVLLGVGIAPGLTTLLAVEAAQGGGPVDVVIGFGAGEGGGPASTEFFDALSGKRFTDPDGSQVRNYTRPKRFKLPAEAGYPRFPALRTDFGDQNQLTVDLGVPVRSYLRLDSRLATVKLAALALMPRLAAILPDMPGGDGWVVAAHGGAGRCYWATGRGLYRATAAITAEVVLRLLRNPIESPTWLHDWIKLDDLQEALEGAGVTFGTGI
ncbi:NAD-dependent epimerase/dehydratase family protein [Rhodococcus marinonascens]|uniref:NAD-dependent epimerase/dehydratase family protein n=1 Tax=Rhodococcus marinonascens TaxID=38311 RepID=UPI000934679C|nr:NAD-dependent epimerase/dehydratase family protein [Rhodococcus marinonascens]